MPSKQDGETKSPRFSGRTGQENTSTIVHPQNVSDTTSDHQASNQQPEVNEGANVNTTTSTRSSHTQLCEVDSASGNDQSPDRDTAPATPASINNNNNNNNNNDDTPATSPAVGEANNSPTQALSDAIGSTVSPEDLASLRKHFEFGDESDE